MCSASRTHDQSSLPIISLTVRSSKLAVPVCVAHCIISSLGSNISNDGLSQNTNAFTCFLSESRRASFMQATKSSREGGHDNDISFCRNPTNFLQTRTNAYTTRNHHPSRVHSCAVVLACLQPELRPCAGVREIFRYLELVVQRLKNGLDVVVLFDELERTIARDSTNFGGEIAA